MAEYPDVGGQADPNSVLLATRARPKDWVANVQGLQRPPAAMQAAEHYCRQWARGEITTRSLVSIYNCFGLVFATRRTTLDPGDVERLLYEDGFHRVDNRNEVDLGDIIIYKMTPRANATHVGIIVAMNYNLFLAERDFFVLSQWGQDGEYLHREDAVPEVYGDVRHYYTDRTMQG